MKKYLIVCLLSLLGLQLSAQEEVELFIGANAGIATGNNSQLVVGIESELLAPIDQTFKVGVATGFVFGTENNGILLPLALAGRLRADAKFDLGLDIGYGLPINKSSGSLYFRPILDYKLSYKSRLRFSYTGLNDIGYINVGLIFRINPRRTLVISY